MENLLDQITELYFQGGNLNEILEKAKIMKEEQFRRRQKEHTQALFNQMFKNWHREAI